jgi:hypothetical protein
MRVKIGARWFEVEPYQAIMIEIDPTERANIAVMPPEARFYATFHKDDARDADTKLAWMKEA